MRLADVLIETEVSVGRVRLALRRIGWGEIAGKADGADRDDANYFVRREDFGVC